MSEQYLVRDRSHIQGPFDLEELSRRVKTRRLARHHQLSLDGIEWRRASEVLPALFPVQAAGRRAPHENSNGPASGDNVEIGDDSLGRQSPIIQDARLPDSQTSKTRANWFAVAVIGGGIVFFLTVLSTFLIMYGSTSGERTIAGTIRPTMVTIKGIHPTTGKKKYFGAVISRYHVVAPVGVAELDGLKVEALHGGATKEWHSAHRVVVDPVAALCVLRCDLGTDVGVMQLQDSKALPERHAELRSVAAADGGETLVEKWELMKVLNKGEPDEQLLLGPDEEGRENDKDAVAGKLVVDKGGRVIGVVVAYLPDGSCVAAPAHEIRSKKKESGKLPADHVIERVDLTPRTGPLERIDPAQSVPSTQRAEQASQTGPESDEEPKEPPYEIGKTRSETAAPTNADGMAQKNRGESPDLDGATETPAVEETKPSSRIRIEQPSRNSLNTGGLADVVRAGAAIGQAVESIVPLPDLPPETAERLGNTLLEDICKEHKPIKQGPTVSRFRKMIEDICVAAGIDKRTIKLTVVEDDELQAYAFVGGNIVVNTGFVDFAAGDADMERFVIGHELGHIALGHVDVPFRRALLAGTLLPGGGAVADQLSLLIKESPLNQADEEAADCFIVKLMKTRKWSTEGGVRFFDRVKKQSATSEQAESFETMEALFGSHPDHARRIDLIQHGCE
jgi:Zn-dependent protease with chaperone function